MKAWTSRHVQAGGQHYETVIEMTYRFNFCKSAFFIQPDFQYIIQPGGTAHLNNALVLGAQLGINF
jgi:porin